MEMTTPLPGQRIAKTKDWKLTAISDTGKRYSYYFDTEADADAASVILMAHSRDIIDTDIRPTIAN
jgi:hypothetical protein